MKVEEVKAKAFCMPLDSPAYSRESSGKFINREFFIITYETDLKILQDLVPEPLKVVSPTVKYEFIRMNDTEGFGVFQESGQLIEVQYNGKTGNYARLLFLDGVLAPLAAGREIWGFPKKIAQPRLTVRGDTLVGELNYEGVKAAVATMAYKQKEFDLVKLTESLANTPNFLLKTIPNPSLEGLDICQLVSYHLERVKLHWAYSGTARLQLFEHAMAPVADLPVKRVQSAVHFCCDLVLGKGKVIFDYLKS